MDVLMKLQLSLDRTKSSVNVSNEWQLLSQPFVNGTMMVRTVEYR